MADATLNELRQRLTRVESRLCRVADHLGIVTGDPTKGLDILDEYVEEVRLCATGVDVSLSDIYQFLQKCGIKGKVARVYFHGQKIADVYPLA